VKVGTDTKEQKNRSTFAAAATSTTVHIPTGISGFDRVLSGGLVAGNVILFGGFRGSGKSTLLVQVADSFSTKRKTMYCSSEQSAEGVVQIAHRAGARNDGVIVLGNQKTIEDTLAIVKEERVFLTIFDSLQKFTSNQSGGSPGSASQGSAVASAIKEHCRTRDACAIVVNQMSRSGELRGGTDVEHDLDTIMVLAFPDDKDEEAPNEKDVRLLVVDKNRSGNEGLKSFWCMSAEGAMEEVSQKSKIISMGKYRKKD
jgi:DNA repair protein RadA/Sms